jgi:SAM-dependent methyltransferase
MERDLTSLVIEEFSSDETQRFYREKAKVGLWDSEKRIIKRYFTRTDAALLDLGCGTGRTTIPLARSGYRVIGVDLTPAMIENARAIAKEQNLTIDYRIGDATQLAFDEKAFDYALFSNQGWTQIPGRENRRRALREIHRVLKDQGIFVFTTHRRAFTRGFMLLWIKQWIRFFVLKRLGARIPERDFGDRFFDRETLEGHRKQQQYVHIPTIREVEREIRNAGFRILEIADQLQVSKTDVRKYPPVFYVCEKR